MARGCIATTQIGTLVAKKWENVVVVVCYCKLRVLLSLQMDRSTREIELGLEYGSPAMNLAGQSLKFENGQWVAGRAQLGVCGSAMVAGG